MLYRFGLLMVILPAFTGTFKLIFAGALAAVRTGPKKASPPELGALPPTQLAPAPQLPPPLTFHATGPPASAANAAETSPEPKPPPKPVQPSVLTPAAPTVDSVANPAPILPPPVAPLALPTPDRVWMPRGA